jgi:hypothetical protein
MSNNTEQAISKSQAKELLWRRGVLSWMLDENQKALYELFHKNPTKIQTWLLARRSGKTYTLLILAIEYCIKYPNSVVKFVGPTKDQIKKIVRKILDTDILTEGNCPQDLKPDFNKQDSIYYFGNGSELQLCAAEAGNIDSIRGGFANIAIVDEAQDVSDLKYAVNSVLLPTTLTTKGKILISGTPSKDPDHEFNFFIEKAQAEGVLTRRTIFDNPRLSKQDIDDQITAMGGAGTEDFRREFLCERIRSKKTTVIPEFDEDMEKKIVVEWKRPPFYFPYTSMDLGFRDMTIVIFAYHDFMTDKVVIEDEIVRHGDNMHLASLARDIEDKEQKLWEDPITCEKIKVKDRVADHDLIAIQEIKKASNYRIHFNTADKKDMMSGINFLRTLIKNEKVIINPRCKTVINHLINGKWANTQRDNLAHGADGSHYDAIPALSYLMRAIRFEENPYPKNYNSNLRPQDAFYMNKPKEVVNEQVYFKMLNLQKRESPQNAYAKLLNSKKDGKK